MKVQPSIFANYTNIDIYVCVYGFRHTGRRNWGLHYSVYELIHLWLLNQKMDGKRGHSVLRYQVIINQQTHARCTNSSLQAQQVRDQY